ncbi:ribose 5-phosphate isomerase B [Vibrio ishigakensis]|uniref:Ribose 5-phosphate isomerase B n=1 Tax=Vibrio ishigakensis TaxID=1481914 RepID=A0A0B8Q1C1_9VIBR|nr:ribose 5-phosphate isomerase B [Vibrio ishigakensis]
MSIAIGCDDAAVELKEVLKAHLSAKGIDYVDYGADPKDGVLYQTWLRQ